MISAAEVSNAQAIHPGYGFLSENADFAEKCRACNIEFIGPPPEAMHRLGNKNQARKLAQQAKVPVVPGSEGLIDLDRDVVALARQIGFPVLIKAAAGGGGRGMRVVREESALVSSISSARQEAEAAFKDGSIYMEKYIERPRHIEVQLLGDRHGNIVHLFERDCSLQRRHQKLVEESPAPNLPEKVRRQICDSAVKLAKSAGYYSADTCEFLLAPDNSFYFIEVNARIQVEHPVTELVTGIDLVREQIRIAAGLKLSFRQKDIVTKGHAIECRINAEDPAANFRPSPGTITRWQPPGGPGIRLDTQVISGYRVPPNYDSLVAKLLVHQPTRDEAIAVMRRALGEFRVEGIHTTIPIHHAIMNNPEFSAGRVDTTFIERTWLHG
ncbi:MAG: acetyl/propionyl/methylcrotonyl-CoA carboxylase subunit alpha [Gemmataceae bacterium]